VVPLSALHRDVLPVGRLRLLAPRGGVRTTACVVRSADVGTRRPPGRARNPTVVRSRQQQAVAQYEVDGYG